MWEQEISKYASETFVQLFSFRFGPTGAPPEYRLRVLKEALDADAEETRLLALKACDVALETGPFMLRLGPESQGLREPLQSWAPATYGDWFAPVREVWRLLEEHLDTFEAEEREKAVGILTERAGNLSYYPDLADMVLTTFDSVVTKGYFTKKEALIKVLAVLDNRGDELPQEAKKRWEQIRDKLTGTGFDADFSRYVETFTRTDFDSGFQPSAEYKAKLATLATEALANGELLEGKLPQLVTKPAEQGYIFFGEELAKKDTGYAWFPRIKKALREAGEDGIAFFLSGYLNAMFEAEAKAWDNELDVLAADPDLCGFVPEITWRTLAGAGIPDEAAKRILDLVRRSVIPAEQLGFLRYSGENLSAETLHTIVTTLLESERPYAPFIAFDAFTSRYIYKESPPDLPEALTFRLLSYDGLFEGEPEPGGSSHVDYHWNKLAETFVEQYAKRGLDVAEVIFAHLGEDSPGFKDLRFDCPPVLGKLSAVYPKEVWACIGAIIAQPRKRGAFPLTEWLKEGGLNYFDAEDVFAWAEEDVEVRAQRLAGFAPKRFFREEGKTCFAREVLVRYGESEGVREKLMGNFLYGELMKGPFSEHYQRKKDEILDYKQGEKNAKVLQWIDEYVALLDKNIEGEKIREEREGFYE